MISNNPWWDLDDVRILIDEWYDKMHEIRYYESQDFFPHFQEGYNSLLEALEGLRE